MGMWSTVGRSLTRRPDNVLVRHLRNQVAATSEGVQLALALVRDEVGLDDARGRMAVIEHRGDEHRSATVNRLATAFANPIDREDLFRLSRSIDDVLDNLHDFVRELALFEVVPDPRLIGVLGAIADALGDLDAAITMIAVDPTAIREASLAVRKNEVRRRYQEELAAALSEPIGPHTLKTRELLRRLDVVGLRLGEAADALADGAMKRSH
ncbi:DUF47 domain-containing protein [Serinicoccus chungangensis]|uniref:DUF47 domain-containing protein n=1 Tax=Serinicoccus chungangensis TaxID=767452 RepID=UPI00111A7DE4|nr:DUF47 family protein [Serinicoccus chungangensis]